MVICGIKLGHDASIALIDGKKLIFCHEVEKIGNNARHSHFTLTGEESEKLLNDHGYLVKDLDRIVIDGWHSALLPEGQEPDLQIADYGCYIDGSELLAERISVFSRYPDIVCKSYKHVAGHVVGSYCASPFAGQRQSSYILVWDGGMFPQLYYYDAGKNAFAGIKNLFPLTSMIYSFFAHRFSPFDLYADYTDFSIPGKVMAFAALGKEHPEAVSKMKVAFLSRSARHQYSSEVGMDAVNERYLQDFLSNDILNGVNSPDRIATFQQFIGTLLIDSLSFIRQDNPGGCFNLCITGGAALNITWNSAIRDSGIFDRVWVPPFPSDTGSAIGTACCEMIKYTVHRSLDWSVYSGPSLAINPVDRAWKSYPCNLKQLAYLMYNENEPVVFLEGNAELGPRALGNRSILASPASVVMKHLLNAIKEREYYRPVAPICLEEDAPRLFIPGTPDEYMLFSHRVREEWASKIPAVCHLDGTGRLQTVNKTSNPLIYDLLHEFKAISGLPVLCNTSANLKGKGFFPDVQSAIEWGKVNLIWSKGELFIKEGHGKYLYKICSINS